MNLHKYNRRTYQLTSYGKKKKKRTTMNEWLNALGNLGCSGMLRYTQTDRPTNEAVNGTTLCGDSGSRAYWKPSTFSSAQISELILSWMISLITFFVRSRLAPRCLFSDCIMDSIKIKIFVLLFVQFVEEME